MTFFRVSFLILSLRLLNSFKTQLSQCNSLYLYINSSFLIIEDIKSVSLVSLITCGSMLNIVGNQILVYHR